MSQTHWKKLHNPDYIGAYALEPGKTLIVTIKTVKNENVTGPDGKKEECMVMTFSDPPGTKPMIVNSTNAKTIEKLYNTPYIEEWAGRKIELYTDRIKAFGEVVDALRIKAKVPSDKKISTICGDCKKEITGFETMTAEQVAQRNLTKYGLPLCVECAGIRKELSKGENVQ